MESRLYSTNFPALKLFRRGKVRDVYDLGDALLLVATDRISAFDVIMDDPVPGKGAILTEISLFWFRQTASIVRNHLITANADEYPPACQPYAETLRGRSMLVRKTAAFPVECVVRGYLAGSGWKEYRENGAVCGVQLPAGLLESSRLPEAIFTPATKAESGHDENIRFEAAERIVGADNARRLREFSLRLYAAAAEYAASEGIIIADTKFEFGLDPSGEIILIDEALTPDSSRFWLKEEWSPGAPQTNFDKQILRDYLETLDWDKQPPPPRLPQTILDQTRAKYAEALRRLARQ